MAALIAIDPGDRYTGVAFFDLKTNDIGELLDPPEWECVDAQEFDPIEFLDALAETVMASEVETIVYERFRLYGDKANEQKGSEFLTAQGIGVIKFIARIHNAHVQKHLDAEKRGSILSCEMTGQPCATAMPRRVEVVGQMADIKKPAAGILRHKGIKSVAKPIARKEYEGRDHIVDAELHGWYYLLHGESS